MLVIGVLSLVQIIYLTEAGTIIIKSEITLNNRRMVTFMCSQLSELSRKKLPDPHYMLHSKAHNRNSNPTAGTQQKWFSSGFNKLHNITVKPDCGHSHNDKELR